MGASNTPLYDLIELSGITVNTTFTTSGSGGGTILGFVDNATYTDGDGSNSATQIAEINDQSGGNSGTLRIDGVTYDLELVVPSSTSQPVTVTYNDGASSINLTGDGGSSNIAFLMAIPTGGGATRYFAIIDDDIGDLPNITSIQTRNLDYDPAGDDVMIDLDQNNNITVCFASGTLIETTNGLCNVEDLRLGDDVITLDHGPLPVLWIHSATYQIARGTKGNRRRPIRIKRGALGTGMPMRDLVVSPQHRILINSKVAERVCMVPEVLVPAVKLVGIPGIDRAEDLDHITYWHFFFGTHQIVYANGTAAESLLLEHQALQSLPREARLALRALSEGHSAPVRPIMDSGPLVRELLRRHRKNTKALCRPLPKTRRQVAMLRLVQRA